MACQSTPTNQSDLFSASRRLYCTINPTTTKSGQMQKHDRQISTIEEACLEADEKI
jgi:hypothetical protein